MASYNDIIVTNEGWSDVYTLIDAPTTTRLYIQNKSADEMLYWEGATEPSSTSVSGMTIAAAEKVSAIPLTGLRIWLKSRDAEITVGLMGIL